MISDIKLYRALSPLNGAAMVGGPNKMQVAFTWVDCAYGLA
jgi:hypothetical protein